MKYIHHIKLENKYIKYHLIFWAVFVMYEVLVLYSAARKFPAALNYFTYYSLNISFFYVNAHITLPSLLRQRNFWGLLLLFIPLDIIVYLILKYSIVVSYVKMGIYPTFPGDVEAFFRDGIWRAVYMMGISGAYGFALHTFYYRKENEDLRLQELLHQIQQERLEKELLSTENSFIKAQINPHFLFNTLSFIYDHIAQLSETAGESVLLLSDVMHYALANPGADGKVGITAEIEQINNYIQLNQFRFGNRLALNFEVEDDMDGVRVPPLILMTILENMFKYGELLDPEHPATFKIAQVDGRLLIHVANKKSKRKHSHSTGIGMQNVEKRLANHYNDQYLVNVEQTDDQYKLTLQINAPQNELLYC